MRDSVLRIAVPSENTEKLFPGADVSRTRSGLNVLVSDSLDEAQNRAELLAFLDEHGRQLGQLRDADASVELDIGLTVGSPSRFTASVSFDPETLRLLASLGIGCRLSAYPCADDDE